MQMLHLAVLIAIMLVVGIGVPMWFAKRLELLSRDRCLLMRAAIGFTETVDIGGVFAQMQMFADLERVSFSRHLFARLTYRDPFKLYTPQLQAAVTELMAHMPMNVKGQTNVSLGISGSNEQDQARRVH